MKSGALALPERCQNYVLSARPGRVCLGDSGRRLGTALWSREVYCSRWGPPDAEADRFPGATVTFLQSPMVMWGIFKNKRPDSLGIMTSLLIRGHFKTPLYRPVPTFCSHLSLLSPQAVRPKNIFNFHWGAIVAIIPSCFSYIWFLLFFWL